MIDTIGAHPERGGEKYFIIANLLFKTVCFLGLFTFSTIGSSCSSSLKDGGSSVTIGSDGGVFIFGVCSVWKLGTRIGFLHFGHLRLFPAVLSGALSLTPQPKQEIKIGIIFPICRN
jgi:hypothetical protein